MTLNKKGPVFPKKLLLLLVVLFAFGCAVQQKPQGGPRDLTPPKLLKASPPNLTRNFSAKQIQLDFDEYFRLVNQYQEITLFPALANDKQPEFKIKQKSLVIDFKDTLQKNTTYVLNFGKGIADVNEGNVLKNFTYVLSTGPHIDSLTLSGTVTNSLTQQKEKDVTVMIFTPQQDSLLFGKKKPSWSTTTDTAGNFSLGNLKEGIYKIYALKEPAPNKIYDNELELIAFSKKPIRLRRDTSGIKLSLFKQVPEKRRFAMKNFDSDGKMFFSFNKPFEKPSVRILYPPTLNAQKIVDINPTKDTIYVYSKNMDFDSVRVAFYDNGKPVDTTTLRKGLKEAYQRNIALRYHYTRNGTFLSPGADLNILSNLPIASFDASLITLKEDSTIIKFNLLKDTANLKKLSIKYKWKPKANYLLTFNDGALTSIYGDINKKQGTRFSLDKPENFSNLNLKVTVPDTGKVYLVELLNDQKLVVKSDRVIKNTTLVYKNYYTGKYTVRVIYDANRNGRWDAGNLKANTQPENIWINDKVFTLRANWESEEDVAIPKEVISP